MADRSWSRRGEISIQELKQIRGVADKKPALVWTLSEGGEQP
jgi:hypothetical protein